MWQTKYGIKLNKKIKDPLLKLGIILLLWFRPKISSEIKSTKLKVKILFILDDVKMETDEAKKQ